MNETILILKNFPTHVKKTNNKYKENKYWKINSQSIYNGYIGKFTRAIVINNIHNYILSELKTQKLPKVNFPVQLILRFFIPINYSTVKMSSKDKEIKWELANAEYKPNNDEDNITWIWNKCIKDCLTKLKVWEDDNIQFCIGTDSKIIFIEELKDRKIEISFKNNNEVR